MMWYDGMGWWWIFGGIWMFIIWGGLIALIIWGISRLTGHGWSGRNKNPMDTARERYARGELSKEEFEQIKKDLS